jgi:hypothetical protein
LAAKNATKAIPIVFSVACVPVEVELVHSLLGPAGTLPARHDDRAGVGRGPPDLIPSGQ